MSWFTPGMKGAHAGNDSFTQSIESLGWAQMWTLLLSFGYLALFTRRRAGWVIVGWLRAFKCPYFYHQANVVALNFTYPRARAPHLDREE